MCSQGKVSSWRVNRIQSFVKLKDSDIDANFWCFKSNEIFQTLVISCISAATHTVPVGERFSLFSFMSFKRWAM